MISKQDLDKMYANNDHKHVTFCSIWTGLTDSRDKTQAQQYWLHEGHFPSQRCLSTGSEETGTKTYGTS